MTAIAPDGSVIGRQARERPLKPARPGAPRLARREIAGLLRERGWTWTWLARNAWAENGRDVKRAFYLIRDGKRAATPQMIGWVVAGFGRLTPEQTRRLHVAAALDAGYRIGG